MQSAPVASSHGLAVEPPPNQRLQRTHVRCAHCPYRHTAFSTASVTMCCGSPPCGTRVGCLMNLTRGRMADPRTQRKHAPGIESAVRRSDARSIDAPRWSRGWIGFPNKRVQSGILRRRQCRAVSPEMALRPARLFGNSPESWLRAQRAVDPHTADRSDVAVAGPDCDVRDFLISIRFWGSAGPIADQAGIPWDGGRGETC